MSIPDQSHLNHVRDALWEVYQSNASVMVGAGFSRNARKSNPSASDFPLWNAVTEELCFRLYPEEDQRRNQALSEASGTSGFLKLAQEYEAAFGRTELHKKIRDMVPDEDFTPDSLHKRLLSLPWKDVFTTNWDTLLERATTSIPGRAYSVIRTPEDIPTASNPRIIKLHGTFPSHIPFIFTEEDYRTYPKNFAPFVNMAQQSMMESVMLLIGFSGDDPNFLHWSGWVRDNIGELSPKIYLAGWLDLSPHRRRMLEDRNVVPIDLALHPKASTWPDDQRHQLATEWIIASLEAGKPYDFTSWPNPERTSTEKNSESIQPIERINTNAPKIEPGRKIYDKNKNYGQEILSVSRIWEHNREVYPGWIIFPPSSSFAIQNKTDGWEYIFIRHLNELDEVSQLFCLNELIWRKSKMLEHMPNELEELVETVLTKFDLLKRKIGSDIDQSKNWWKIRSCWIFISLELLTHKRTSHQISDFNSLLKNIEIIAYEDKDIYHYIQHEKCLLDLKYLNYKELEKNLNEWDTKNTDPIFSLRKAAILCELDKTETAKKLVLESLHRVRGKKYTRSITSQSIEGWGLIVAGALSFFDSDENDYFSYRNIHKRSQELSSLECNAYDQKRTIYNDLTDSEKDEEKISFELGSVPNETIKLYSYKDKKIHQAISALRLTEATGLPSSANHAVITSDIMAESGRLLSDYRGLTSILIIFLVCSSDDDAYLSQILSRNRTARLPKETVKLLHKIVSNHINYLLPKVRNQSKRETFWVSKLRVAIEVLSRITLRLTEETAMSVFDLSIKLYKDNFLVREFGLSNSMYHLLLRSWQALSPEKRKEHAFSLMKLPIEGLDEFGSDYHASKDPGQIIIGKEDYPNIGRNNQNESDWKEAINLISKGLKHGGKARERASLRLATLCDWGNLKINEEKALAEALWDNHFINDYGLPIKTHLLDWVFLKLPQIEKLQAETAFRKKWLSEREFSTKKEIHTHIYDLGTALYSIEICSEITFSLSDEDKLPLIHLIELWVKEPFSSDAFNPFEREDPKMPIMGLQHLLYIIPEGSTLALSVFEKVKKSINSDQPEIRLLPYLIAKLPEKLEEIIVILKLGLSSDTAELAKESVWGINNWIKLEIDPPPIEIINEIGVMISIRKKSTLNYALMVAHWIFIRGKKAQKGKILHHILNGLTFLQEELSYDRDSKVINSNEEIDIPLLRWRCVNLALNMEGYKSEPAVSYWIETAKNDPLPEVRYVSPEY